MSIAKNYNGVKFFSILDDNTRLHVQDGNKKLGKGIATVNLMPGSVPGRFIKDNKRRHE